MTDLEVGNDEKGVQMVTLKNGKSFAMPAADDGDDHALLLFSYLQVLLRARASNSTKPECLYAINDPILHQWHDSANRNYLESSPLPDEYLRRFAVGVVVPGKYDYLIYVGDNYQYEKQQNDGRPISKDNIAHWQDYAEDGNEQLFGNGLEAFDSDTMVRFIGYFFEHAVGYVFEIIVVAVTLTILDMNAVLNDSLALTLFIVQMSLVALSFFGVSCFGCCFCVFYQDYRGNNYKLNSYMEKSTMMNRVVDLLIVVATESLFIHYDNNDLGDLGFGQEITVLAAFAGMEILKLIVTESGAAKFNDWSDKRDAKN